MRLPITGALSVSMLATVTFAAPAKFPNSTCPFRTVIPVSLQKDATSTIYTATVTTTSTIDCGHCMSLITVSGIYPLKEREAGPLVATGVDVRSSTSTPEISGKDSRAKLEDGPVKTAKPAYQTETGALKQRNEIDKRFLGPVPAWGPCVPPHSPIDVGKRALPTLPPCPVLNGIDKRVKWGPCAPRQTPIAPSKRSLPDEDLSPCPVFHEGDTHAVKPGPPTVEKRVRIPEPAGGIFLNQPLPTLLPGNDTITLAENRETLRILKGFKKVSAGLPPSLTDSGLVPGPKKREQDAAGPFVKRFIILPTTTITATTPATATKYVCEQTDYA